MSDKRVYNVQQLTSVLYGLSDTALLDCPFGRCFAGSGECNFTRCYITRRAVSAVAIDAAASLSEPVAYILGYTEFWGLRLQVMPGVLIPRPDTECLVTQVLQDFGQEPVRGLDLGAGSAAISLALASERRNWRIDALERSDTAVHCAQYNYTMHCDSIAR